jgi:hypothetical protein
MLSSLLGYINPENEGAVMFRNGQEIISKEIVSYSRKLTLIVAGY